MFVNIILSTGKGGRCREFKTLLTDYKLQATNTLIVAWNVSNWMYRDCRLFFLAMQQCLRYIVLTTLLIFCIIVNGRLLVVFVAILVGFCWLLPLFYRWWHERWKCILFKLTTSNAISEQIMHLYKCHLLSSYTIL